VHRVVAFKLRPPGRPAVEGGVGATPQRLVSDMNGQNRFDKPHRSAGGDPGGGARSVKGRPEGLSLTMVRGSM
jgi:hypothetical protein